jgi:hypothetical protein
MGEKTGEYLEPMAVILSVGIPGTPYYYLFYHRSGAGVNRGKAGFPMFLLTLSLPAHIVTVSSFHLRWNPWNRIIKTGIRRSSTPPWS